MAAACTICPRCWWKDDGQGDEDAAVVRGTVNGAFSLEAARRNYGRFGTMYPPPTSRTMRALGRMGEGHPRLTVALIGVAGIGVLVALFVFLWFVLPYSGNSATLGQSPASIRAGVVLVVLPIGLGGAALTVLMADRRAEDQRAERSSERAESVVER